MIVRTQRRRAQRERDAGAVANVTTPHYTTPHHTAPGRIITRHLLVNIGGWGIGEPENQIEPLSAPARWHDTLVPERDYCHIHTYKTL
jgi:hypothetical protein